MHNLTNRRFGRLLALEDVGSKEKSRQWECLCDCGNKVVKKSATLLTGRTKSCGCLRREVARARVILPPGEAVFNGIFKGYKYGAQRKGREFSLTKEQFRVFITSNCYYCGTKPNMTTSHKRGNGSFVHGGIDRADNDAGYTPENSLSCCTSCNFMKSARNKDEFLSIVKRIYENTKCLVLH